MSATIVRSFLPWLVVLALALISVPAVHGKGPAPAQPRGAAPAVTTITGSPLTIRVGDEHSYQIFNDAIPGVGQIYPSGSSGTADMGWHVRVDGTLYAPDYGSHGGSATGGLGSYTPYGGRTVSAVSGAGTSANPFLVTVGGQLGASGLVSSEQVRYVSGENHFSKQFTLTNTTTSARTVSIFLGGDIYLAGSDSGIPYLESASGSVGGSDCGASPSYYILYIPQTPADAYTGSGYSSVWSQIGGGALDNALSSTSCIDNGAALQWNRTIQPGSSVTVLASTSFGDLPDIVLFNIFSVAPASGTQGSTVNVTIQGIGFADGMTVDFGAGITVTNLVVVNGTTATATLVIAPAAAIGPRDVVGIEPVDGLSATLPAGFSVTGAGEPPPPPPPPAEARPVPALGTGALIVLLLGIFATVLASVRRLG